MAPSCLPFGSSKSKRPLSWNNSDVPPNQQSHEQKGTRRSPTSTITSKPTSLFFHSDSEQYDEVPTHLPIFLKDGKGRTKVHRSNTMTGSSKKSTSNPKWGYGWGAGKKDKEREAEEREKSSSQVDLPTYEPVSRHNSKSTQATRSSQRTQETNKTQVTFETKVSQRSKETARTGASRSTAPKPRPPLTGSDLIRHDSSATLVGSAYERKIRDNPPPAIKPDTVERVDALRRYMDKDRIDYYVIPSEDAHGSEYVAASDKRREFMTGFTGSSGQAIVSRNNAYLLTDSRFFLQAEQEIGYNWTLVRCGEPDGPTDWVEWLIPRVQDMKIGIDARMISHQTASFLNKAIINKGSKLIFPSLNYVDLVWANAKPQKPLNMVYIHTTDFTGTEASYKLDKVREWINKQPPDVYPYSKSPPTPSQIYVGTLVSSLPHIAYLLNLRGSDIPYNPLFHAYLYIGLDRTVLFVDLQKLEPGVVSYLQNLRVHQRNYQDFWPFMRRREWGEGKVIITPQTSYSISLMLTSYRYTSMPSMIEKMMSIKNATEIDGLRRAYLRDGVSFVRFLAWLDAKMLEGYEISEYEAQFRLTEFKHHNKNFMGLACQPVSATGPNAAQPHYVPNKHTSIAISRETPYLIQAGAQYFDGTCETTRTVHFGRPTPEMCEAYTRVLQGHIAIDTAVFPENTSGRQLDVLARKALWKEGMDYYHSSGRGFGSFLTVHEGPHGFNTDVTLEQGHVVTNEPGFYLAGKWGMRIESALSVRRWKTHNEFGGDRWLGFERFTCVPIQTRMVKESMLTKEEKQWLKDHNQRCYDRISPFLKDDARALKWLKREAERLIGLAPGIGPLHINWD